VVGNLGNFQFACNNEHRNEQDLESAFGFVPAADVVPICRNRSGQVNDIHPCHLTVISIGVTCTHEIGFRLLLSQAPNIQNHSDSFVETWRGATKRVALVIAGPPLLEDV
jgi:hypothetical protein